MSEALLSAITGYISDIDKRFAALEARVASTPAVVVHGDDGSAQRPEGATAVLWFGYVLPEAMNEHTDVWFKMVDALIETPPETTPDEPATETPVENQPNLTSQQTVSDDFYRNNGPIGRGARWDDVLPGVEIDGHSAIGVVPNAVQNVIATAVNGPNHYAQANIIASVPDEPETWEGVYLYVRLQPETGDAAGGYYMICNSDSIMVNRFTGGNHEHLGRALHGQTMPYTAYIEAVGDIITVKVNGVTLMDFDETWVAAKPAMGGNVGFGFKTTSDTSATRLDRFRGGQFVEATA